MKVVNLKEVNGVYVPEDDEEFNPFSEYVHKPKQEKPQNIVDAEVIEEDRESVKFKRRKKAIRNINEVMEGADAVVQFADMFFKKLDEFKNIGNR